MFFLVKVEVVCSLEGSTDELGTNRGHWGPNPQVSGVSGDKKDSCLFSLPLLLLTFVKGPICDCSRARYTGFVYVSDLLD